MFAKRTRNSRSSPSSCEVIGYSGGGAAGAFVQVLLDVVVDLGGALRWQRLDELVDWFGAVPVAVVDGLRLGHQPRMPQAGRIAPPRPAPLPPRARRPGPKRPHLRPDLPGRTATRDFRGLDAGTLRSACKPRAARRAARDACQADFPPWVTAATGLQRPHLVDPDPTGAHATPVPRPADRSDRVTPLLAAKRRHVVADDGAVHDAAQVALPTSTVSNDDGEGAVENTR